MDSSSRLVVTVSKTHLTAAVNSQYLRLVEAFYEMDFKERLSIEAAFLHTLQMSYNITW